MTKEKSLIIMVVEDNEFMKNIITQILRGHQASYCKTGKEAVELYNQLKPQVIFLDLMLPDVSGYLVLKMIKKINPNAFVVIVSGENKAEDIQKAMELGAKGYIVKPYSKVQVDKYIEKFINENYFDELF